MDTSMVKCKFPAVIYKVERDEQQCQYLKRFSLRCFEPGTQHMLAHMITTVNQIETKGRPQKQTEVRSCLMLTRFVSCCLLCTSSIMSNSAASVGHSQAGYYLFLAAPGVGIKYP